MLEEATSKNFDAFFNLLRANKINENLRL